MLEFNESNFELEVEKSDLPVLVDFWATWCGPCLKMMPIVEEIAQKYEGKLKVGKVNVESASKIAQKYGIRSIPTLLLFKEGKVEAQIVGVQSLKNLEEKINEALSNKKR